MSLKSILQDLAVAAAGAVVPSLPLLLQVPPTMTARELAQAALSAACAVGALYLRKYKPAVAPESK